MKTCHSLHMIVFGIEAKFAELCSKRTKSEARKIAGFVHLMRG